MCPYHAEGESADATGSTTEDEARPAKRARVAENADDRDETKSLHDRAASAEEAKDGEGTAAPSRSWCAQLLRLGIYKHFPDLGG